MNKKFKTKNSSKLTNYYQLNKFYYKTSKQLPFIKKITISIDQKSIEFKQNTAAHLAFKILFNKKSVFTKVKQSNIFYKIKKGQPVGCKLIENNKIKIFDVLKIIFKMLFLEYENENYLKINKKNSKYNLITFSIFEIYNFKKLENFYLLFHKLKKLNISCVIFSYNKNYKETNYLFSIQKQYFVSA